MGATNSTLATSAEQVRRALAGHVEQRSYTNITLRENLNPQHDPRVDDYRVIYEAELWPRDLEHAYFKVLVLEDGRCGVGIETRARVAERVGIPLLTRKSAFAAGKEFMAIGPEELVALLNIIGSGKFFLKADRGLVGLGKTEILFLHKEAQELVKRNDHTWDWILVAQTIPENTRRSRILTYAPW